MKSKRHSPQQQIVHKLRQAEARLSAGASIPEICREPGVRERSKEDARYRDRREWGPVRREGRSVNKKRVHRLWREAGLKVPARQRKRRRLGGGENGCARRRAEHKDRVWSYDFVMGQT